MSAKMNLISKLLYLVSAKMNLMSAKLNLMSAKSSLSGKKSIMLKYFEKFDFIRAFVAKTIVGEDTNSG